MLEPIPRNEAVVGLSSPFITPRWLRWLTTLRDLVIAAPVRVCPVQTWTGQTADVSATAFPAPPLRAGTYRVSTYARITSGAGTVTPTVGTTDGAVAVSVPLAAVSGTGSASAIVRADADAVITVAFAVTGGATFDAIAVLERVEE